MDAHEVMEKLNYIVRHPHVAADAVDDLFDEWRRQNDRIAELEETNLELLGQIGKGHIIHVMKEIK